MTEFLEQVLGLGLQSAWHFLVVFLRLGAVVSVMPGFGESMIPARVKIGVALAFTVVMAPLVSTRLLPASVPDYFFLSASEIVVGLAIGLGLRLFVLALQTAGSIAANSTSLAQVLGAASLDPLPAISHVLVVAGLALAAAFGLHVRAVELMALSYELFPLGQFPDANELSSWGVARISHAFALAFTLATPFVIGSLIYNLALGAINRAMPQLMVAFVGAPVITFGGLALLMLSAPTMLQVWVSSLQAFAANPLVEYP